MVSMPHNATSGLEECAKCNFRFGRITTMQLLVNVIWSGGASVLGIQDIGYWVYGVVLSLFVVESSLLTGCFLGVLLKLLF